FGNHLSGQISDVPEEQLEHHLQLAGFAVTEPIRNAEPEPQGEHDCDAARDERVVVEGAEECVATHLDRGMSSRDRVSENHLTRRDSRNPAAARTTWATPSPRITNQILASPKASPMAIPIMLKVRIRSRLVARN